MGNFDLPTNEDLQKVKSEILAEISKMFETHFKRSEEKIYLSSEEVKEKFGIKSVNTLKRYLVPKKFGNKNLYSVADIKKLIESDSIK